MHVPVHRKYGVTDSGPMDKFSAALANQLVGNSPDRSVIEITMAGPRIRFHIPVVIALTGADLSPEINGKPIKQNRKQLIRTGDVLSFGAPIYGARTYLAIGGALTTERESQSILPEKALQKGQFIGLHAPVNPGEGNTQVKPMEELFEGTEIEVRKGPEFASLPADAVDALVLSDYTISHDSNRMGIRLAGSAITVSQKEILTGPVIPGTVQLPPSGQPIVLMKDCQTTGGYPRILCLPEWSMARLAQKRPGESIRFQLF